MGQWGRRLVPGVQGLLPQTHSHVPRQALCLAKFPVGPSDVRLSVRFLASLCPALELSTLIIHQRCSLHASDRTASMSS